MEALEVTEIFEIFLDEALAVGIDCSVVEAKEELEDVDSVDLETTGFFGRGILEGFGFGGLGALVLGTSSSENCRVTGSVSIAIAIMKESWTINL